METPITIVDRKIATIEAQLADLFKITDEIFIRIPPEDADEPTEDTYDPDDYEHDVRQVFANYVAGHLPDNLSVRIYMCVYDSINLAYYTAIEIKEMLAAKEAFETQPKPKAKRSAERRQTEFANFLDDFRSSAFDNDSDLIKYQADVAQLYGELTPTSYSLEEMEILLDSAQLAIACARDISTSFL